MYAMLFVATLEPDYIYIHKKRQQEELAADLELDRQIEQSSERADVSTEWLKGFEKKLGVKIPQEVARHLEKDRIELESKMDSILNRKKSSIEKN